MEYTKTVWKDLPDTSTPITASRLNNIEDGVEYLFENGTGGGDNLPVGVEIDFDGASQDIPTGWQETSNTTQVLWTNPSPTSSFAEQTITLSSGNYDFYENYQVMDSGFSNVPQLIIICEDDKHIAETFKEIVVNKLELPKIKLYFTTDLRQNEETLDKTLVGFKIDEATKKYKMIDIEVKLLGM